MPGVGPTSCPVSPESSSSQRSLSFTLKLQIFQCVITDCPLLLMGVRDSGFLTELEAEKWEPCLKFLLHVHRSWSKTSTRPVFNKKL